MLRVTDKISHLHTYRIRTDENALCKIWFFPLAAALILERIRGVFGLSGLRQGGA